MYACLYVILSKPYAEPNTLEVGLVEQGAIPDRKKFRSKVGGGYRGRGVEGMRRCWSKA